MLKKLSKLSIPHSPLYRRNERKREKERERERERERKRERGRKSLLDYLGIKGLEDNHFNIITNLNPTHLIVN